MPPPSTSELRWRLGAMRGECNLEHTSGASGDKRHPGWSSGKPFQSLPRAALAVPL